MSASSPTGGLGPEYEHRTAAVNGTRLHHVLRRGARPGAPPVVLLHGWPTTWYEWRKVMPLLAAEGRTVVAPDTRGLGDSEKPAGGYDKRTVAEDIRQLARALGHGQMDLVGHDLGAVAALTLAYEHPGAVRRLVLADMPIPGLLPLAEMKRESWHIQFHSAPAGVPEMLTQGREREYIAHFLQRAACDQAAVMEDLPEFARAYSLPGAIRAGFEYYRAFGEDAALIAAHAARGPLAMPVLAVRGAESDVGAEVMRRQFERAAPHARHADIPGSGHWIPAERPGALAREIARFLDEA